MKLFLKQRNMYYMKYLCLKVSEADISIFCCNSIIDSVDLSVKEKLINEKMFRSSYYMNINCFLMN